MWLAFVGEEMLPLSEPGLTQLAQRDACGGLRLRIFIVFLYYKKWHIQKALLKLVTVNDCVKYSSNHEKIS